MSTNKVAQIITEFLKEHWLLDTEGLTAKEIVDAIYDFQQEGPAWQRTASLVIEFDAKGRPNYLYWESGSQRTAMVIDGATAAMADCGSSVPDLLERYATLCREAGMWPVSVFHLTGGDGPLWIPAGAILDGIRATVAYPHVRHPER